MAEREVMLFAHDAEVGEPRTDFEAPAPLQVGERSYPLVVSEAVREGRGVDRCILCGYEDLHLRKDFPRALGIAIIGVAAVSMFFIPGRWFFLPLVGASAIDFGLYYVVPWKVVCYVCHSEYRGFPPLEGQAPYDLEHATECSRRRWPVKGHGG